MRTTASTFLVGFFVFFAITFVRFDEGDFTRVGIHMRCDEALQIIQPVRQRLGIVDFVRGIDGFTPLDHADVVEAQQCGGDKQTHQKDDQQLPCLDLFQTLDVESQFACIGHGSTLSYLPYSIPQSIQRFEGGIMKAMRVYFSGIGGVGIGPLAEIAHDAGYEVCGSDREAGLMTEALQVRGIQLSFDQSGAFLAQEHARAPFDWFVHTAALPEDHPELVLARSLGIRTGKRDELLAQIITEKNLKLVAVAGTHGKTTTTGMLVWTLQQLGVPVSYSVGSTLSFGPSGAFDPASQYFIYECDEFDRNFLHFQPWLSLVTSVDYDHPDTYPTEDEYLAAFRQFGKQSERVLTWPELASVFSPDNLTVVETVDPRLTLTGEHNRRNGTLVVKAIEAIRGASAAEAINSFPGTGRRFEKLADNLYSDYGHHPIEIAAALQLARELSEHVVLVYQPHQNVRQHEIRAQYTDEVFRGAEEIYWLPTYLTREDPALPVLTPHDLTAGLTHPNIHHAELDDALWERLNAARGAGKLVLCMGAGTIDSWVRQQLSTA